MISNVELTQTIWKNTSFKFLSEITQNMLNPLILETTVSKLSVLLF